MQDLEPPFYNVLFFFKKEITEYSIVKLSLIEASLRKVLYWQGCDTFTLLVFSCKPVLYCTFNHNFTTTVFLRNQVWYSLTNTIIQSINSVAKSVSTNDLCLRKQNLEKGGSTDIFHHKNGENWTGKIIQTILFRFIYFFTSSQCIGKESLNRVTFPTRLQQFPYHLSHWWRRTALLAVPFSEAFPSQIFSS